MANRPTSKLEEVDGEEWVKKNPAGETLIAFVAACVSMSRTRHPDRDALIIDAARHLETVHRSSCYIDAFKALIIAFRQIPFRDEADREMALQLLLGLWDDAVTTHNEFCNPFANLIEELQTHIPPDEMEFRAIVPSRIPSTAEILAEADLKTSKEKPQ